MGLAQFRRARQRLDDWLYDAPRAYSIVVLCTMGVAILIAGFGLVWGQDVDSQVWSGLASGQAIGGLLVAVVLCILFTSSLNTDTYQHHFEMFIGAYEIALAFTLAVTGLGVANFVHRL